MNLRRARWTLLLAGLSLLAGLGRAGAAPTSEPVFYIQASPGTIRLPGMTELEYRLVMKTGDEAERFTVDLHEPAFRVGAGTRGTVRQEGSTITLAEPVSFSGPGAMTPVGEGVALVSCSPNGPAAHGYEPHIPGFFVEIPAHSTATMTARYRTGDMALWPDADLRLRARISPRTDGMSARTLERSYRTHSSNVAVEGTTGSRIELFTKPGSSVARFKRVRRVPVAKRLQIYGRVEPVPPARRIALRVREPDGRVRLIARARTDAKGRFRVRRWSPTRRGVHEITATVPSAPNIRRDHSCPVVFRAR